MSRLISFGALGGAMLAGLAACEAPTSSTDLHTAGPPKVQQVLITEEYTDSNGIIREHADALAYGHHDDPYFMGDDGKVVSAVADFAGRKIRVVMDHLLVGNYLEMVQCRAKVDLTHPAGAENYSIVPLGATPDDIAKCAGPEDLVLATCRGDRSVCINNTGVDQITDDPVTAVVHPGEPAGIKDIFPAPDGDGVPDSDIFIEGAVRIICHDKGGRRIEAPINTIGSYWQPSGNQQVPAHGGVEALGPALVLELSKGLPTNTTCSIAFDPSVIDNKGDTVCAPPDGNPDADCPGDNDTSQISFGVTGLRMVSNQPADGASVTTNKRITVKFNTTMDEASLAKDITVTENGVAVPITVTPQKDMTTGVLNLTYELWPNGTPTLKAASTYVVTVTPNVKDFGEDPLGGAFCPSLTAPNCTFTFSTP